MNKAELKAKWSEYCDTDKLVDDVMALLTKYHHENTEHGVCVALDTYFTNKKSLIDMFKTSDNYVGDMRIVIDFELERGIDSYEVRSFCRSFMAEVDARSVIYKYTDEDGKTLSDYITSGIMSLKASDLLGGDILTKLNYYKNKRSEFCADGTTIASSNE